MSSWRAGHIAMPVMATWLAVFSNNLTKLTFIL
jgi:hypothetical protein